MGYGLRPTLVAAISDETFFFMKCFSTYWFFEQKDFEEWKDGFARNGDSH